MANPLKRLLGNSDRFGWKFSRRFFRFVNATLTREGEKLNLFRHVILWIEISDRNSR